MSRRIWLRWRLGAGLAITALAVALTIVFCSRQGTSPLDDLQTGLKAIRTADQPLLDAVTARLESAGRKGELAILQSQIALMEGRFDAAVSGTWIAERHAPATSEFARAIRIEARYAAGQLADAEAESLDWLRHAPDQPVAHRWLAAVYYDLGAMDQAKHHLQALIRSRPTDPAPRSLLGIIFHDYERFEDAVGTFRELLSLPNLPASMQLDATLRLADSLIRLQRHKEALELLNSRTDSPVAFARSAECHLNLGDMDKARLLISKAAASDPANPDVLSVLGQIQLSDQEYAAAEISFQTLLKADPANVAGHHNLAQCYRLSGRTAEADQQLQRHGQVQQTMIRLAELHQAAIQRPKDPEIREEIAGLLDTIGRARQAAMWRAAADGCRQTTTTAPFPPPKTAGSRGPAATAPEF